MEAPYCGQSTSGLEKHGDLNLNLGWSCHPRAWSSVGIGAPLTEGQDNGTGARTERAQGWQESNWHLLGTVYVPYTVLGGSPDHLCVDLHNNLSRQQTLFFIWKMKKAQREEATELVVSTTRMETQTVWPPDPQPCCLWSQKGWEENTDAVNLMHPWLQSCYLPFNLVRSITPFKTIKDLTPKVLPTQQTSVYLTIWENQVLSDIWKEWIQSLWEDMKWVP